MNVNHTTLLYGVRTVKLVMDVKEAFQMLKNEGITKNIESVRRWIRSGELKATLKGTNRNSGYEIKEEDLHEFILSKMPLDKTERLSRGQTINDAAISALTDQIFEKIHGIDYLLLNRLPNDKEIKKIHKFYDISRIAAEKISRTLTPEEKEYLAEIFFATLDKKRSEFKVEQIKLQAQREIEKELGQQKQLSDQITKFKEQYTPLLEKEIRQIKEIIDSQIGKSK